MLNRDRQKLEQKLDFLFSEYIRQRGSIDGFNWCFTCDVIKHWKELECGHFVGRSSRTLRWDELNCHPQCHECNCHKANGNRDEYARRLNEVYGEGTAEALVIKGNELTHFTKGELLLMIEKYRA